MPEAERKRPRTLLIVVSLTLALCISAGAWLIDYMGKFGMFMDGRTIADEIHAEMSRRGVHCAEDSTLLISDRALHRDEFLGLNQFITSISLFRGDGSSLDAEIRLTRIQPSAPWLEGVREGEVIRLRFQCMDQKVIGCIETDGAAPRFYGPVFRYCPANLPVPPIAALRLTRRCS